jgi:hypothetical protein
VRSFFVALFIAGLLAFANSASAQAPVAIVEDEVGDPGGLQIMDYVRLGKTIELRPDESLTLSYLNSCVREVIRGGAITVGREQSETRSTNIERSHVACDAAKMVAPAGRSIDVAGMVLRSDGAATSGVTRIEGAEAPEFILYGTSPLVELNGDGRLVIARLDTKGEFLNIAIDHSQLRAGRFLDLADRGETLTPGGVYGARWEKRLVVFKIDPGAKPGKAPIIGRLMRLGFAPGGALWNRE